MKRYLLYCPETKTEHLSSSHGANLGEALLLRPLCRSPARRYRRIDGCQRSPLLPGLKARGEMFTMWKLLATFIENQPDVVQSIVLLFLEATHSNSGAFGFPPL